MLLFFASYANATSEISILPGVASPISQIPMPIWGEIAIQSKNRVAFAQTCKAFYEVEKSIPWDIPFDLLLTPPYLGLPILDPHDVSSYGRWYRLSQVSHINLFQVADEYLEKVVSFWRPPVNLLGSQGADKVKPFQSRLRKITLHSLQRPIQPLSGRVEFEQIKILLFQMESTLVTRCFEEIFKNTYFSGEKMDLFVDLYFSQQERYNDFFIHFFDAEKSMYFPRNEKLLHVLSIYKEIKKEEGVERFLININGRINLQMFLICLLQREGAWNVFKRIWNHPNFLTEEMQAPLYKSMLECTRSMNSLSEEGAQNILRRLSIFERSGISSPVYAGMNAYPQIFRSEMQKRGYYGTNNGGYRKEGVNERGNRNFLSWGILSELLRFDPSCQSVVCERFLALVTFEEILEANCEHMLRMFQQNKEHADAKILLSDCLAQTLSRPIGFVATYLSTEVSSESFSKIIHDYKFRKINFMKKESIFEFI